MPGRSPWSPWARPGNHKVRLVRMEAFPTAAAPVNLHTAVCGGLLGVPIFPAFVGGPGMGGGRGTSRPRFGSFLRTSRGRHALPEGRRQTRVTGEAVQCRSMPVEGRRGLRPDLSPSECLDGPPGPPGPGLETTKCGWYVGGLPDGCCACEFAHSRLWWPSGCAYFSSICWRPWHGRRSWHVSPPTRLFPAYQQGQARPSRGREGRHG